MSYLFYPFYLINFIFFYNYLKKTLILYISLYFFFKNRLNQRRDSRKNDKEKRWKNRENVKSSQQKCNILARRGNWRPSARDSSSLNQPSLPPLTSICFNHSSTASLANPCRPKIGQTFHFVSSLGPPVAN